MATRPIRTGARFAAVVAAFSLIVAFSLFNTLLLQYLRWSNGYIPRTRLPDWVDYWVIQVVLTIVCALLAFGVGFVFQLVRNRLSKQAVQK